MRTAPWSPTCSRIAVTHGLGWRRMTLERLSEYQSKAMATQEDVRHNVQVHEETLMFQRFSSLQKFQDNQAHGCQSCE